MCHTSRLRTSVTIAAIAGMGPLLASASVIFVDRDAAGLNDGSSWPNAFVSLSDALAAADADANVTEIWVAEGTYTPSAPAGDRNASFAMRNGLALYGGFVGDESSIDQRTLFGHRSILSGDLNADDDPNFAGREDNSRFVVVAPGVDDTAVLDGFWIASAAESGLYVIAGGPIISGCTFDANGSYEADGGGARNINAATQFVNCDFRSNRALNGAGMSNEFSTIDVSACTFRANSAFGTGGGISSEGSHITISNCLFRHNESLDGFGGGVFNAEGSNAEISDSHFAENSASNGGGLFNSHGVTHVSACSFIANIADGQGGAIANGQSDLTLSDCTLVGNAGPYGAGLWIDQSAAVLEDCRINENTSDNIGGGMFAEASTIEIYNSICQGNTAATGGGAYVLFSTVDIHGSLYSDNRAEFAGGFLSGSSKVSLTNCTVAANRASQTGGGVYIYQEAGSDAVNRLTVANSIVWNNSPNSIHGSNVKARFSLVSGGLVGGAMISDVDPRFVDADGPDNDPNTIDDNDYHLLADSPAINAGDNTAVSADLATDVAGNPRYDACRVDLGAYEFVGAPEGVLFGDLDGDGTVNLTDLALMLANFNESGDADLDHDGVIQASDLVLLLSVYGARCGG